jgi:prepilin-type N-terminal cleavage/methylation domain-containing protein
MKTHGFTLLELMIVLFIVALLSGMIAPRLLTWYDSLQAAYERDDVLARLNELAYQAFQKSQDFTLTAYPTTEKIPLELPQGWQLVAEQPIKFRANGACTGGKITLQFREYVYHLAFIPPFCALQKIE